MTGITKVVLLSACALAVAGAWACDQRAPIRLSGPELERPGVARAPHSPAPLSPARIAAVVARGRLPHGLAEVNWVADLHARVMQDALSRRAELAPLPRLERCRRLVHLVRSYFPEVARRSGVADAAAFERAIEAARAHVGCGAAAPLSIFSIAGALAGSPMPQSGDTVVTGAYEAYVPSIESAVANAGSLDEAVAALDRVLVNASALSAPDFQVVAAMASLAASSASYWYAYLNDGNDGNGGGGGMMMSVFAVQGFSWREFALADFGGGLAVAGALRLLGFVHPYLLIAGFFAGAAIASGDYAYQHMQE